MLMSQFFKEVYAALKGMELMKASWLDGFSTLFFQRYWHIVGQDVCRFYLEVLIDGRDLSAMNVTKIVPIPKILNPTCLKNFRSISLCNVLYKVIDKMVANRLQRTLESCIDQAQSAFVPKRQISDNILLAYELLHTLRNKRLERKGFMDLKLNMSKTYDRVE